MTATHVLVELADHVAEDGPGVHHPLLSRLAALVVDAAPGTAAALADAGAPDVVRGRALAVATALLLRCPLDEHR